MNATAQSIEAGLSKLRAEHAYAHRCTDGRWHNPNAGAREHCPTVRMLDGILSDLHAMTGELLLAATDPDAIKHVCWAATGLDLYDLQGEDQEGWAQTVRDAITGMAGWLDENVPRPPAGMPVLDLHAEDQEAEAARYAAAVEDWRITGHA